jgi:hypothetical protein
MSNKTLIPLLLISLTFLLSIQKTYSQQDILSAYKGTELVDSLNAQYKPDTVLTYSQARDTLFGNILSRQDSLSCVYTNYTIFLDPEEDPTTTAFDQGINAEHAYPRSKGAAAEVPEADMHNLFPSRENVNSDRADLPFGDIPDNLTEKWYYGSQNRPSKPPSEIDNYSELGNGFFEPRESVKGDIARAMFYFYTMYQREADLADQNYFDLQKNTLCEWHQQDPVDQAEWNRNMAIAPYQDNKPNPYILDCSLAFRAFCPEQTITACAFTRLDENLAGAPFRLLPAFPNPFSSVITIRFDLEQQAEVQVQIFDFMGRSIGTLVDRELRSGQHQSSFNAADFPAGMYTVQLVMRNKYQVWYESEKVVKY